VRFGPVKSKAGSPVGLGGIQPPTAPRAGSPPAPVRPPGARVRWRPCVPAATSPPPAALLETPSPHRRRRRPPSLGCLRRRYGGDGASAGPGPTGVDSGDPWRCPEWHSTVDPAPPRRRPPLPGPAVAAARRPFPALSTMSGGEVPQGVAGGVGRGSLGGGGVTPWGEGAVPRQCHTTLRGSF